MDPAPIPRKTEHQAKDEEPELLKLLKACPSQLADRSTSLIEEVSKQCEALLARDSTGPENERAQLLVNTAFLFLSKIDKDALSHCKKLLKRSWKDVAVLSKTAIKAIPVLGPGLTLGIEGSDIARLGNTRKTLKPHGTHNACFRFLLAGMKCHNSADTKKLATNLLFRVGATGASQGLDFGLADIVGSMVAPAVESAACGLAGFLGHHAVEHGIEELLKDVAPDVWAAYLAAPVRRTHLALDVPAQWRLAESYRLLLKLLLGAPLEVPWKPGNPAGPRVGSAHVCRLFDELHGKDWKPGEIGTVNLYVLAGMHEFVWKKKVPNLLVMLFEHCKLTSSDAKTRDKSADEISSGRFQLPNAAGEFSR
jgi:hypothetical protein